MSSDLEKVKPVRAKENFLVFGAPLIEDEEIAEVLGCMKSGWLGTGPKVHQFEESFRQYKGVPFANAVNSCTAAIHLSLVAAGIKPGDEVITTPMTFCATVNAIIHAGGTPVLADIDPVTLNIDPEQVKRKISPKTKAILPVHFAGHPCDMDALCQLADEHGLLIIEDCAHAIETEYKGRKAGTFGDFGCFSFYVTKNIVTGEGGMLITQNPALAERAKILSLHGMSKDAWKRFGNEGFKHYQVVEAGFKYNMMDLQAAIGVEQLAKVERFWERREQIWKSYGERFSGLPIQLPANYDGDGRHAYHLYTVLVDEASSGISRDDFLNAMTLHGIGVGVHYLSIPEHPYYQERFGWKPEEYPVAARVGRSIVSLPISPKLTDSDLDDVDKALNLVLQAAS